MSGGKIYGPLRRLNLAAEVQKSQEEARRDSNAKLYLNQAAETRKTKDERQTKRLYKFPFCDKGSSAPRRSHANEHGPIAAAQSLFRAGPWPLSKTLGSDYIHTARWLLTYPLRQPGSEQSWHNKKLHQLGQWFSILPALHHRAARI